MSTLRLTKTVIFEVNNPEEHLAAMGYEVTEDDPESLIMAADDYAHDIQSAQVSEPGLKHLTEAWMDAEVLP